MKIKSKNNYGIPGKSALNLVRNYFPKVNDVRDAIKPTIVSVTPNDNKIANLKSHKTCALAVACKRTFKADGVLIGLTISYVIKGKIAYRYKNTDTISREITSFDRKAGFATGLYQLTPISPSNRLGVSKVNPNRPSGAKGGKSRFMHFTTGVRTALGRGEPEVN